MFVQVNEMPKSGQFVMVWEHNGVPWTRVFKHMNGDLFTYDPDDDDWVRDSPNHIIAANKPRTFLIVEED